MKKAVRAIVLSGSNILVMKRNKFGKLYYTLPGGGVNIHETTEQALKREMYEETGINIGRMRPVFIEQAGEPYGVQYIYLTEFLGGEPALNPMSDEAAITAMGQNLYEPMWLPIADLPNVVFISDRLKAALIKSFQGGFPNDIIELT